MDLLKINPLEQSIDTMGLPRPNNNPIICPILWLIHLEPLNCGPMIGNWIIRGESNRRLGNQDTATGIATECQGFSIIVVV